MTPDGLVFLAGWSTSAWNVTDLSSNNPGKSMIGVLVKIGSTDDETRPFMSSTDSSAVTPLSQELEPAYSPLSGPATTAAPSLSSISTPGEVRTIIIGSAVGGAVMLMCILLFVFMMLRIKASKVSSSNGGTGARGGASGNTDHQPRPAATTPSAARFASTTSAAAATVIYPPPPYSDLLETNNGVLDGDNNLPAPSLRGILPSYSTAMIYNAGGPLRK